MTTFVFTNGSTIKVDVLTSLPAGSCGSFTVMNIQEINATEKRLGLNVGLTVTHIGIFRSMARSLGLYLKRYDKLTGAAGVVLLDPTVTTTTTTTTSTTSTTSTTTTPTTS